MDIFSMRLQVLTAATIKIRIAFIIKRTIAPHGDYSVHQTVSKQRNGMKIITVVLQAYTSIMIA
jgi:hypothetical protein